MDHYKSLVYHVPEQRRVDSIDIIPNDWEIEQPLVLHAANGMYDKGIIIPGSIKKYTETLEPVVVPRKTFTGREPDKETIQRRLSEGHLPQMVSFQDYPSGIHLKDMLKDLIKQGYAGTISAEYDVHEFPELLSISLLNTPQIHMRLRHSESIEALTEKAYLLGFQKT